MTLKASFPWKLNYPVDPNFQARVVLSPEERLKNWLMMTILPSHQDQMSFDECARTELSSLKELVLEVHLSSEIRVEVLLKKIFHE